jgi:hypothetical protein
LFRSAQDKVNNTLVAIKMLTNPCSKDIHAKRAYREFCLLKTVNHTNVSVLLNKLIHTDSTRKTFKD